MGGDDVAIVGPYGFSEKGLGAGKNRSTVGCSRKVVDARSRMDKMVVRS